LNNPEKAIKEYKKIAKEYSNSQIGAEALLRIGNIYRRILIKPVDAIATYQGILESPFATSKLGAEAIFGIGMSYYNDMQDYIKASEAFKKLLNDYPTYWKYPAGIYWLGMCHEKLGDYENAIRNFELFYEIYPDEEPVWLADIGRFGEKDVKPRIRIKIDELKKTEPSMRWNKAEELLSQGSYIESLSAYQELISKHPDSEYSQRAKIQADKIKYLAEIQICKEKIKRKDISAPASQYRIAEIFETQMQDYLRAIEEYEKLVSEYPGTYWSAAALYRIGFIYSRTDSSKVIPFKADYKIRDQKIPDYRKAIEIYNRLISEYPGTYIAAEAQYQIGEIYTNNIGDHNKAIEEYGKFVKKYPRRNFYMGEGYKDSLADEAQFKIGKIYYENLRDYDMALKAFRAFTEEYPDSCRKAAAYSYIAAILEKINEPTSSVNFLEQAIQLISDSHIQTSFFLTNSFYDVKPSKNLNVQQDIIRQLKQRAYKIKGSTD